MKRWAIAPSSASASPGASKVLTWCPTCTKNFDELEKDVEEPFFDLGHVSEFLAANVEALKARFVDQPKRRVVIHEHLGIGATVDSIRKLLRAVPNLELVELVQDSGFSYACGGQAAKFKDRERAIHRGLVEGAVEAAPTPSSPCTIPAIARCPAPRRSIRRSRS